MADEKGGSTIVVQEVTRNASENSGKSVEKKNREKLFSKTNYS